MNHMLAHLHQSVRVWARITDGYCASQTTGKIQDARRCSTARANCYKTAGSFLPPHRLASLGVKSAAVQSSQSAAVKEQMRTTPGTE